MLVAISPLPKYTSMTWCSFKAQGNFTFYRNCPSPCISAKCTHFLSHHYIYSVYI